MMNDATVWIAIFILGLLCLNWPLLEVFRGALFEYLLAFWLIILLLVARHVRVFSAVRAEVPRAAHDVARHAGGLIRYAIVQTRMYREPGVGLMHLGLFLGSTILLLGNMNFVLGGLPQAIVSIPLDGLIWTLLVAIQQVVAVFALVAVVFAAYRPPPAATAQDSPEARSDREGGAPPEGKTESAGSPAASGKRFHKRRRRHRRRFHK